MTEMIDLLYFMEDIFKLNKPKVSKVENSIFKNNNYKKRFSGMHF